MQKKRQTMTLGQMLEYPGGIEGFDDLLLEEYRDRIFLEVHFEPEFTVDKDSRDVWVAYRMQLDRLWLDPDLPPEAQRVLELKMKEHDNFNDIVSGKVRDVDQLWYAPLDAMTQLRLGFSSHEVAEVLSDEEVEEAVDQALSRYEAGDSGIYLNFMDAAYVRLPWEALAFERPAFVALLPEVPDMTGRLEETADTAAALYQRAKGSGTDRPVHHLTRFARNVEAFPLEYATNPLGPGVQVLVLNSGERAMSMSFTLEGRRPCVTLSFMPVEGLTSEALRAHEPEVNDLLGSFYRGARDTLALFDSLGDLEGVEAWVEEECPTFQFRLSGREAPYVPYQSDELLQTHLLLNLAETFHQRRLLLRIRDLVNSRISAPSESSPS